MIDLTPLDVRNKRGDFKRILRGYDPQEVDIFLELAADRLEDLVREVMHLRERTEALQEQVSSQTGREHAVQEALVSAQELRKEISGQAQREADLVLKEVQVEARRQRAEAEAEIRRMLRDAERRLEQAQGGLEEMERRRLRFLKAYRQLLEREMDVVLVEAERKPLEDKPIELDLVGGRLFESPGAAPGGAYTPAPAAPPSAPRPAETTTGTPRPAAPPPAAPPLAEATRAPERSDTYGTPEEVIQVLTPDVEPRPPLDMPVDELAALYEGLEEPLDALAARYGILRGRGPVEPSDATETASRGDGHGQDDDPAAGEPASGAETTSEERAPYAPQRREGPDDPRWG